MSDIHQLTADIPLAAVYNNIITHTRRNPKSSLAVSMFTLCLENWMGELGWGPQSPSLPENMLKHALNNHQTHSCCPCGIQQIGPKKSGTQIPKTIIARFAVSRVVSVEPPCRSNNGPSLTAPSTKTNADTNNARHMQVRNKFNGAVPYVTQPKLPGSKI